MEKEGDLRIRRTKKLLLDSLMQLLQEHAFEKIGVNDICERAMVHRATFYNHFDDKYDLFNYALSQLEDEMYLSTIEKGSNPDYWIKKIERNRDRDMENDKKLLFLGWTVIHFWGKDILRNTDECIRVIEETIWDIRILE